MLPTFCHTDNLKQKKACAVIPGSLTITFLYMYLNFQIHYYKFTNTVTVCMGYIIIDQTLVLIWADLAFKPKLLHGPSMIAVNAKIYGVIYNQSSSIAFDETSSHWSTQKSS